MGNDLRSALRSGGLSSTSRGVLAIAACVCIGATGAAHAQVTETVILDCNGNGADGCLQPQASLLADTTGPSGALRGLYGTDDYNQVFKLTPPKEGQTTWKSKVLRWFFNIHSSQPNELGYGALFSFTKRITSDTPIYGVSYVGGKAKYSCESGYGYTGCGTVFSLTGHKATEIWDFTDGSDGGLPNIGVIGDKTGALYTSTTEGGGSSNCGTIVQLAPPANGKTRWTENTLYAFTNGDDGCMPQGLIIDEKGALYGDASSGGATGNGTIFKLIPPANGQGAWTEQTLWSFQGGSDGTGAIGPLTPGIDGTLYGTTNGGGTAGYGIVFALTPPAQGSTAWVEQILWNFTGGADGANPSLSLIIDKTGALYGTASGGGAANAGTVFKLTPPSPGGTAWTETTPWAFTGGSDGGDPNAALTADNSGVLYSTTFSGGSVGGGVVFSLTGTGFVP